MATDTDTTTGKQWCEVLDALHVSIDFASAGDQPAWQSSYDHLTELIRAYALRSGESLRSIDARLAGAGRLYLADKAAR